MIEPSSGSVKRVNRFLHRWARFLLIGGLILLIGYTLFPFNFALNKSLTLNIFINHFYWGFNESQIIKEGIRNGLLAWPFGFALAGFCHQQLMPKRIRLFVATGTIVGLSLVLEILQMLLPARTATVSDVVSRSIGGCIGFLCFHVWHVQILSFALQLPQRLQHSLSPRTLAIVSGGYFAIVCTISVWSLNSLHLSNWNPHFPFILGNETTGNRPWNGYVASVALADRSASDTELLRLVSGETASVVLSNAFVAANDLRQQLNGKNTSGSLKFRWQGSPVQINPTKGAKISATGWLIVESVNPIMARIQQSSQFTLVATVASAESFQSGPARIISLSEGPTQRNLTLGQEGTNLVIRLRTPMTGLNGSSPELIIPDIFQDTNLHRLVIAYDPPTIRVCIDGTLNSYTLRLEPEITLWQYLLPLSTWAIRLNFSTFGYKCIYYSLVFIPLGVLVNTTVASRISLIIFPFVFEGVLLTAGKRSLSLNNLLLSSSILLLAFVCCRTLNQRSRFN